MIYSNVSKWGNKLLFRAKKNGKDVLQKIDFKPTLFAKGHEETGYKGLMGEALSPIKFDSITDAQDFVDRYKDVESFPVFGNTDYSFQAVRKLFPDKIEGSINDLSIMYIDIETTSENGFPNPQNPIEEVISISVSTGKGDMLTFAYKPTTTENVVLCGSEKDLLIRFITHFSTNYPDIVTGWNSNLFDVPYLVARCFRVVGDTATKRLSPWGIITDQVRNINGRDMLKIDIKGVSLIDYLDLYKKFVLEPRESYKLDYIGLIEVGEGKLESMEHESFKDFYTHDFDNFLLYNQKDVELVIKIEAKRKLLKLLVTIAFEAKCQFNEVFSPVKTWDCILYNKMADEKIIPPLNAKKPGFGTIEGAYVHTPVPGMYKWVVSFDATSLYPSIILQYNISPETIVDDMETVSVDGMLNRQYPKETKYSLLANGAKFTKDKKGFFPQVVQEMFDDRQKYKKLMLQRKQQLKSGEGNSKALEQEIASLDIMQHSRKILLNSLYGASANEGFRFFDHRIAEGITKTGQLILRNTKQDLDKFLNKLSGTEDVEYVIYCDTDSVYCRLDEIVGKHFSGKSENKLVDLLDKMADEVITPAINKSCDALLDYMNGFERKIYFKREAIASNGFWTAKKKYALRVLDNEGVRYKEPEIKVMGLELVRSSTPEPARDMLKRAVEIVLTQSEAEVQAYIKDCKKRFLSLPVKDIAFPRSVNGLTKYAGTDSLYIKGTPSHVKGALLFNSLVEEHGLGGSVETIKEGDKMKFFYLKEPNPIGLEVLAFTNKIPTEFGIDGFVDYERMWYTAFMSPVEKITIAIGWTAEKTSKLEGFVFE